MLNNIKQDNMTTLNYSTSEINRNFKIKVYGMGINKAVGVKGFVELVEDINLCNRLLERAFNSSADKCICKLRRGVKVTFYYC